jgi:protein O-GlcNAc transferase
MVRKLRGAVGSARVGRSSFDREAELNRAARHYNAGRLDEACEVYAALCVHDPTDVIAWFRRALVRHQQRRYEESIRYLREALSHTEQGQPLAIEISMWLAKALSTLKSYKEAQAVLQDVVKLVWDDVDRLAACIDPFIEADAFEHLEPVLRRIVELSPRHLRANAELSLFEFRLKNYRSAVDRAHIACESDPETPAALRVLGHVHHELGDVKMGVELYGAAIDCSRRGKGPLNIQAVYESMLGAMVYADVTDEALRSAHEAWRELSPSPPSLRLAVSPRGDRPLRVGYVSPDFRDHAVAFFFEPLLHNHDERIVTPILYSNTRKHDDVTARIRGVGFEWRDVVGLSDADAAQLIERDKIDILVDLAGFTVDNRMGVFRRAPAPLLINYLGYPSTTGLLEMDYRFTDEDCDPLGETDGVYTEQLIRLPGGFYAWRPPDSFPTIVDPPATKNGYITFGSLNTLAKITDDVIALWSVLLDQVSGSRLVLQAAPFADAWVRERIFSKFESRGIARERIDMHGRMTTYDHLLLYNEIDIALDPFPWGGHTTTCTALFMSVPVVTLRGRRMASRMSASVLHRLGFDAWIAETSEQYVQIAKSLAVDVERLRTIRAVQRTVFAASGLLDGHRLARAVEAAYLAIWDHHAETSAVNGA